LIQDNVRHFISSENVIEFIEVEYRPRGQLHDSLKTLYLGSRNYNLHQSPKPTRKIQFIKSKNLIEPDIELQRLGSLDPISERVEMESTDSLEGTRSLHNIQAEEGTITPLEGV
jgi:hypothetical protein